QPPQWGGPIYILAAGGLAAMGMLAGLLIYFLLRPRRERSTRSGEAWPKGVTFWSVAALMATGGLILAGGPRAHAVLLILGGWLALVLAGEFRGTPGGLRLRSRFSHYAVAGLFGLSALGVCLLLLPPTLGTAIARAADRE